MEIEVGDRVKLKKDAAQYYVQPWRGRLEKGRFGTVVALPFGAVRGFRVKWDHRKVKFPYEWEVIHPHDDLVVVGKMKRGDAAKRR